MLWQDVLVQCPAPDSVLAGAVADVFAIDPGVVLVVDDVTGLDRIDDGVLVLVERRLLEGVFRLYATLTLRDARLERDVQSREATFAALQRLAARLDCAVLTDDESLDPSAYLLIRGSGTIEPVTLDDDRLDNEGFVSVLTSGADEHGLTGDGSSVRPSSVVRPQ